MREKTKEIRSKWNNPKLGEICDLVIGKTPSRKRDDFWLNGTYPWCTIGDMGDPVINSTKEQITQKALEETKIPLIPKRTILLSFKLSLGKVAIAGTDLFTNEAIMAVTPKSENLVLNDYLFYVLQSLDLIRESRQAVKGKTVNKKILRDMPVILPPLPVQERIVQILQKADDIRRKRQDALDLADAILSASFIGMFGDPANNHDDYERVPLSKIADVRSGVTKGRKLRDKETVEVPYLRVANVQDGFLDLTEMKIIEVLPDDVDKYHLEDGDILMTEGGDPDKLGRGAVWRNQIEGCIHQNHIFRVRTNLKKLAPEYLAALLRTQYAKNYFLSCAKRSSNLASINSTQVKAFPVPLPSIKRQEKFVSVVEQWVQASERLTGGLKESGGLFASLMDEAFSGQLTAEWEAVNADWITAQVELQERLPRLLLLALIRERAARTEKAGQIAVLVTALMKYAFLFQMEGSGCRRFYQFVPYHYGPFAKELYTDLERLQADGLVTVSNDAVEDKTRITLADPARTDAALAELPDDLKEDVAAILDAYGDLDHNALLKTVYEKYPAYAKKSRVRGKRSK